MRRIDFLSVEPCTAARRLPWLRFDAPLTLRKDNHAERNYRDVRIAPVWEGTTQIQALDLLGRKVMLGKLMPIAEHCGVLAQQTIPLILSPSSSYGLRKRAFSLLMHAAEWGTLTLRIAAASARNMDAVSGSSEPYLMFGGYVSLASHWLKVGRSVGRSRSKSLPSKGRKTNGLFSFSSRPI